MRLPFLRKTSATAEPLIVAMTGVRLGESVLFAGRATSWVVQLAARTGLSGRCVVVGPADLTSRIEAAASREGVLVERAEAAPATGEFDLTVVETVDDWEGAAAAALGATRPGGRIVVATGTPARGLLGRLSGSGGTAPPADLIASRLGAAGWQRVRPIGDRDGVSFVEGFARV